MNTKDYDPKRMKRLLEEKKFYESLPDYWELHYINEELERCKKNGWIPDNE